MLHNAKGRAWIEGELLGLSVRGLLVLVRAGQRYRDGSRHRAQVLSPLLLYLGSQEGRNGNEKEG
mgnify:CR=1 FL=1